MNSQAVFFGHSIIQKKTFQNNKRTSFLSMCCFKRSLRTRMGMKRTPTGLGNPWLFVKFCGRREGRHRKLSALLKACTLCPLPGFLDLSLSFLPLDFATMCLSSCDFTGKAVSQINGYMYSVCCVFVQVANFASGNRDWLKSDNPMCCLSFLLSGFSPVVCIGRFSFLPFPS